MRLLLILLLPVSAAILLIVSILPLIFLPFMLIAQISARLFLKNYRSAITGNTATMAAQKRPYNIGYFIVLDGILDYSKFKENTLNLISENIGKEQFLRLQQFAVSFLGYSFFVADVNFDIENHVKLAPAIVGTEESFKKYLEQTTEEKLVDKFWDDAKSPWEVEITHFRNNSGKNKTLLVVSVDHMLMDAFSGSYLIQELSDAKVPLLPEFTTSVFTKFQKFQFYVIRNLYIPWDFLSMASMLLSGFSKTQKYGDIHRLSESFQSSFADFSVTDIRALRKKFGVKYETILYSAVGASISRMLKELNRPCPKYFTMVAPLPKPNHPYEITNHFYCGQILVPIDCKSVEERLQETDYCLTTGKSNTGAVALDYFTAYSGYLIPRPIYSFMFEKMSMWTPIGASSLPPVTEFSIGGLPCSKFLAGMGVATQYMEFITVFVGVKTNVNALFRIRHDLIPPALSSNFGQYFNEEIQLLKNYRVKMN